MTKEDKAQRAEKLIESYIRKEVKRVLKGQLLSESKIIVQADGQKDPLVVGGVGNNLYISQKSGQGVTAVQFTLKQMRKICEFFTTYDPASTTVRSNLQVGQRPRLQTQ